MHNKNVRVITLGIFKKNMMIDMLESWEKRGSSGRKMEEFFANRYILQ